MYFFFHYFFKALGHLARVFGWIGEDLNKSGLSVYNSVTKIVTSKAEQKALEEARNIEAAAAAKMAASKAELKRLEAEGNVDAATAAKITASKAELKNLEAKGNFDAATAAKITASKAELTALEAEKNLEDAADLYLKEMRLNPEPGKDASTFIYLAIMFAFWAVECARRIPAAFKMKFPAQCSFLFMKISICILPVVIIRKIPDIYGFGPILGFLELLALTYCAFIAFIYLLRILIPVDLEGFYKIKPVAGGAGMAAYTKIWRISELLYFFWLLNIVLFKYGKINLCIIALGVFFSLSYFLMPSWKEKKPAAPARIIPSFLILAGFAAASYLAFKFIDIYKPAIYLSFFAAFFVSTAVIALYWRSVRKHRDAAHDGISRAAKFRSWLNFFLVPLVKAVIILTCFYFILMFYTLNTAAFAFALFAVAGSFWIISRFKKSMPPYLQPQFFAAFICLLWISIIFVQSYNRVAPPASSCAKLADTQHRRCLLSMKQYRKLEYLSGALPYDAIMDADENALFVSFKNLSGYGSILRMDADTGKVSNYIVTRNDKFPGKMLYPERLCINRLTKHLFSTTKSMNNFQILDVDYSKGGIKLADRIKFKNLEVTSCEVNPLTGEVYVIFLGPPYSQIISFDGKTGKTAAPIRFGELGYADYFSLNPADKRIVVPSLDPIREFDVYDVHNPRDSNIETLRKPIRLPISLPGGLKFSIPIPTFGIAADTRANKFFFTCPFLKLVFETDGTNFRIQRTLFAGSFPRKLAFNSRQNLLLVANYSGGSVDMIDTRSWKIVERHNVGKLVRSVRVDEQTGRNFAATACGVFELYGPGKKK